MVVKQTVCPTPVKLDLDLESTGKQFGHLRIPRSTNTSAWGELWIPIASVSGAPGDTVVLLGGNHGDEYESQTVLLRLLEDLDPADVTGRLIVVPRISGDASEQGTRLWPEGINFNRVFPGDPGGSVAEQLADYMSRVLFPMADVVADLHSGGRSLLFPSMSTVHLVDDLALRARMIDVATDWLTDFCLLHANAGFAGLLPDQAEGLGKLVTTTELGGAGMTTEATMTASYRGLVNVLRGLGVLEGKQETREDLGLPPMRFVSAALPANYLRADDRGLFDPVVALGQFVAAGELVGRLRFPTHPERASVPILAPFAGYVCALRAMPACDIGDCLAVIGEEVDPGAET